MTIGSTNIARLAISDILRHQAAFRPAATALLSPEKTPLSFGHLWAQVESAARVIATLGIRPNDRVALVLPDGPEMALAFLAVASCAAAAPLNPAYRQPEFEFYLNDLQPAALLLAEGCDSPAQTAAMKLGIRVVELRPKGTMAGEFDLVPTDGNTCPEAEAIWAGPEDIALILHTSGTTSRPKMVPLTGRNLCSSAAHIAETLQLTPEDRSLGVMPLFHIHGLIGVLLSSMAAGAAVVCTSGFDVSQFYGWLDQFQPSWYSGVPTMHQAILARAKVNRDVIARRPLRFIRSSSAALAPAVMQGLEAAFNAPVIEAYGMTEASHQMASNPLPPQTRKPGSVGMAAGPEVAIMDADGRRLAAGAIGEIVIRGSNVTSGYLQNAEANAVAYVGGWFRTGDQGYLDSDGYLFITGRLKELINRGGEKIAPREIDEVLLQHPAVAQAVAFAIPDTRLGEEVGAAVVLRPGMNATAHELQQFAARQLAHFKVPRQLAFVAEIPKGPTGKLQRIGLAAKLGITTALPATNDHSRTFVAPGTPLERSLAELWRQLLAVEPVGSTDHFLDLGGDSVMAMRLLGRIRESFGVELTMVAFFESPTVAGLAAQIEQAQVAEAAALTDEEARRLLEAESYSKR